MSRQDITFPDDHSQPADQQAGEGHARKNGEHEPNRSSAEDSAGPGLISADQLAEQLQVSIRTLWRLRSAGRLPQPVRIGGSIRWRAGEVRRWIEAGCPPLDEWEACRHASGDHHRA